MKEERPLRERPILCRRCQRLLVVTTLRKGKVFCPICGLDTPLGDRVEKGQKHD